jgi:hypothetical protein
VCGRAGIAARQLSYNGRYQDWRKLLHGFYEPIPLVEYFGESIV